MAPLCDHVQMTSPVCASVSSPAHGNDSPATGGMAATGTRESSVRTRAAHGQAVRVSSAQLFLLSGPPLSFPAVPSSLPPPLSLGCRTADQSRIQQSLNHPVRPQAASPAGCLHSAPLRVSALLPGHWPAGLLPLPHDWPVMPLVHHPLACHTPQPSADNRRGQRGWGVH